MITSAVNLDQYGAHLWRRLRSLDILYAAINLAWMAQVALMGLFALDSHVIGSVETETLNGLAFVVDRESPQDSSVPQWPQPSRAFIKSEHPNCG